MVVMAPHTAYDRCYQWLARDHLYNSSVRGKIPALVHTNHLARKLCLPVYKHRFRVAGCDSDRWETYLLADHDVLCLSDAALQYLAGRCIVRDWNPRDGPGPDDMPAWDMLREAADRGQLGRRYFDAVVTPRIHDIIEASMPAPVIPCLRGDLTAVKRVLACMEHAERQWPGLLRDPDVLASLESAAALITTPLATARSPSVMGGAGVREVPARYCCRPANCPHHPGTCNLARPTAAVAKTHRDLALWLKTYAHLQNLCPVSEIAYAALAANPGYRTMVLWHFAEPYRPPTPATPLESVSERHMDRFCALACHLSPWRITVYEEHVSGAHACKWAWPGEQISYHGSRRPDEMTPGCSVCEHWRGEEWY